MNATCYYTCKKCSEEIECEVEIGEGDDLPDACPDCGEPIPGIAHEEVGEAAFSSAVDRAHDLFRD